jgi:transposase-like protein
MKNGSAKRLNLTPAQRGRIVQCVIVAGWTNAEAAVAFGVRERVVAAWVADYRRFGMASLRDTARTSVAAEVVRLRLLRPVRGVFRGISGAVCWLLAHQRPAPPSPLRRSQDDRRGGS